MAQHGKRAGNVAKGRGLTMKLISTNSYIQKSTFMLLAVLLLIPVPALSQYKISWYTIDGGGGQSSGGQYIITGTIGQPDAGYSYGGDYEVLGGFWPGGPLCIVNFEHFARFAQYWLYTGSDIPADLCEDNIVNYLDLDEVAYQWLYYCPYDWPLK